MLFHLNLCKGIHVAIYIMYRENEPMLQQCITLDFIALTSILKGITQLWFYLKRLSNFMIL